MMRRNRAQITAMILMLFCSACGAEFPLSRPVTAEEGERRQVAQAALSIGDYEEAARLYERASEDNPKSIPTLIGLGQSYMALGQFSRAENALITARDLSPKRGEVYAELGNLALHREDVKSALFHYDKALELKRHDLGASTGKAIALDYLSRHAEAQQVYQEALTVWPTNFALMNNYALSLCLSGGAQKGVPILEELVQDPSQGETARSNLALAYTLEGRSRDARAMLEGLGSAGEAAATLRHFEAIRSAKNEGKAIGQMVFQ